MIISCIKSLLQQHNLFAQTTNLKSSSFLLHFIKDIKLYIKLQTRQSLIATAHLNTIAVVSIYQFVAVLVAAMLLGSCKKESVNDAMLNSTASGASFKAEAATTNYIPRKTVKYGALIGAPNAQGSVDFQLNVADQLGISCIRSRTSVPGNAKVQILNTGYKILLNFSSDSKGAPIPFVSNLVKYKADLKNIVSRFTVMPVVAVIENEESNRFFYNGTAQEYISQLKAAIDIMHAYGIKVANGGITNQGLNYLVYKDFLNQGKKDSAEQFKKANNVTPNVAAMQDRGAFVEILLKNYRTMNLDFVNFHWKGTSPGTLSLLQVINYLKKRTNKKIISNELGQFDTDSNTLLSHVQLCTDQNLPYIVWYSPDENAGKKDTPLHHNNAKLTPTGITYKNYLAK